MNGPYYWSTTCRPLVEVGRDEDEELQQDGMVLEDVTAADDEDHDGDDGGMKDVVIHLCILTIMCNYVCVYVPVICLYLHVFVYITGP